MKRVLATVLVIAGCGTPPAKKPEPVVDPVLLAELGQLMKNEINPPFSKLTFLVFHGEGMDDPAVLKAEIQTSAAALRKGIGRLLTWQHPPTTSAEGREVFYSFATSVDKSLARFEAAVSTGDDKTAAESLGQAAKTCDSCHHFFRVDMPVAEGPGEMVTPGPAPTQSL